MLNLRWRYGQGNFKAPITSELLNNGFPATKVMGESTAGGDRLPASRFCFGVRTVDRACERAYAAPAPIPAADDNAVTSDLVVVTHALFNARSGHGLKGGGRRPARCGFLLLSLVHRMIANHLFA